MVRVHVPIFKTYYLITLPFYAFSAFIDFIICSMHERFKVVYLFGVFHRDACIFMEENLKHVKHSCGSTHLVRQSYVAEGLTVFKRWGFLLRSRYLGLDHFNKEVENIFHVAIYSYRNTRGNWGEREEIWIFNNNITHFLRVYTVCSSCCVYFWKNNVENYFYHSITFIFIHELVVGARQLDSALYRALHNNRRTADSNLARGSIVAFFEILTLVVWLRHC
jgi:hypothetical protein